MANVRRLARKIGVDVSVDGTTWLVLPGKVDNAPQINPNIVDATDTDTDGNTAKEITLQDGQLVVKYNSLSSGGTPNAAQELVQACEGQFGDSARLYVRYYDTDGGSRGFQYRAIVKVQYSKTAVADLREVTVTFDSDGTITKLTQSQINTIVAALGTTVPVITSASQTGTGVGSQVKLVGAGFTGTTAVKFGATAATTYTVVSDSVIVANVPTGGTGAVALTVTNGAGTSAGFNFTVS
jgi:hypothetical protein